MVSIAKLRTNMPITINKTDKFFMAACMQGVHNFLCLGVIRKGQIIVLSEIGKAMPFNKRNRYPACIIAIDMICEMLYNCLDSELLNERKLIDGKMDGIRRSISYIAYEINYENYLQLLHALNQVNPQIRAYIQTEPEEKDHSVTLSYQEIGKLNYEEEKPNSIIDHLKETNKTLSIKNNCRSAVNDMARLTVPQQVDLSLFHHYYLSFPCKSTVLNSQFTDELYILPMPPSAYHLDINQQGIVTILYKELEKILSKKTNNAETRDEFESLKTLYTTESGKPHPSIHTLIQDIIAWHNMYPRYLMETRSYCCFWSKTVSVIDEINEIYGTPGYKKLMNRI